jgi:alkyl hydroperoxide reductase subunit F
MAMLDTNIIEQLKTVFAKLENPVDLVFSESDHADQKGLMEMLESLATTSEKIKLIKGKTKSDIPEFFIEYQGKPNGITFRGIPGGHEFTSLIVAILNSDGKGKFFDEKVAERIKRLNGPIKITTFISLTCENCPDVVQSLNQMAIVHPHFSHQMVDGQYVQEHLKELVIQGVPSVVVNDKLVYSGKLNLIDLISKLEETFGIDKSAATATGNLDLGQFDMVVIGGGPAGSSAAIYTARKGLSVAILAEKAGGQVAETKGIENLISVTYTEGPKLVAQLNAHIAAYPVKMFEHRRVKGIDIDFEGGKYKKITLESGESILAKAIIIATGAKWRELSVPGEKEYIGRGVAYCPHCDGPYYKEKNIAVVGGGNSGVEAAIDLAGIVNHVTVIEYNDQLKADKVLVDKLLSMPNVKVVTNAKTEEVKGDGQKVQALTYLDRKENVIKKIDLDGVFVQIGLLPNSQFVKGTLELTKFGEIVIDSKNRTSVKGIYAAGDVTTVPYKQIVIAMGEGARAALAAFEDQMLN